MARKTVYNSNLTNDETWKNVNPENKKLLKEFINYCQANDKSPQTCTQYEAQLKIFFCWNYSENGNKHFVDMKKREFISFFGCGRGEYGWSPNRLSSLRAVLSSLSNYIERVLDEDYPTFRNIVKVLEPIHIEPVREKTIINESDIMQCIAKLVEEGAYQDACFLALLFSSGMRKGEAVQMKIDFFSDDKMIGNGLMYATPLIRTKGKGKRGKQVPRYIFKETFKPYFDLWMKQREELGIQNDALFIVNNNGSYKAATINTLSSWAERLGKKFNIDLYCHALRHSFTTELKKKGYPTSVIQKIQHWASADMVGVYVDMSIEDELSSFFSKLNPDGTYTETNPLDGGK